MRSDVKIPLLAAMLYYITVGMAQTMIILQAEVLGGKGIVGIVVGAPLLVVVISSSLWGYVADYYKNRKRVVIISVAVIALLYLPQPWVGAWELVGIRTIQALFLGGVVHLSTLFSELEPKQRGAYLGLLQSTSGFGWGFGSLIAGLLISIEKYGKGSSDVVLGFSICSVLAIISAIGMLSLPNTYENVKQGTVNEELFTLRNLWICATMVFAGYYFFLSFAPSYFSEVMGSSEGMGYVMFASGAVHAISAPYLGKLIDKMPREKSLKITIICFIICMATYTVTENKILTILAFMPPVWMLFQVTATSLVADRISYANRARAVGLLNSCMFFGAGMGGLLSGQLYDSYKNTEIFGIGTVIIIIGLIFAFWIPKKLETTD